jgi:hypothetical protein
VDDIRNCVGYAVESLRVLGAEGNGSYTTSSIDPWHSAEDVNATGSAQHSGFDVFFTSGLTNGLPAMVPVTLLYGTPEDSAAEMYLKKRGYPVAGSRWVRSRTASTCCRRITVRSTCSGQRRFTK